MSNVLDLFDQTVFDLGRATGATTLLQCVWVYSRQVDFDALREHHRYLRRGRLSRCIEASPIPFGRHRWVSPNGWSDFHIAASARPREQFDAWLLEQATEPLDVERGPGWRLAALPFTDGGAGVSLLISHCLTDGIGLCEALADGARGRDDPVSWCAAGSRRRWQALHEDARQFARDIPAIGRAVVAGGRLARARRRIDAPAARRATPNTGSDELVTVPVVTVFVDADEWDARADSLGGTSNTLLQGMAARLAQRYGRTAADGTVALAMPVNERIAGDTRANATTDINIVVDPEVAMTDLREIRDATKQALIRYPEASAERWAMLQIVPLLPRRLIKRMSSTGSSSATYAVASNIGVVTPAAGRPDGTDADFFAMRLLPASMTESMMLRNGGLQVLLSGRARGQVFLSLAAYQPGQDNSNELLQQDLSNVIKDFSLTGTPL